MRSYRKVEGVVACVGLAIVVGIGTPARASTLPLGIPAPSFGITEVAPRTPIPWNTPTAGFYYVDETAHGATDSNNAYGTPLLPRRTIPLNVPAGAVVELHGKYTSSHSSPAIIVANGTASRPVFIRGVSSSSRPRALRKWQLRGRYFVVENIEFSAPSPAYTNPLGVSLIGPTNSGVLRYNDISGSLTSGAIAVYGGSATSTVSNCVIYANVVHDNGDINSSVDQDVHGVSVGAFVSTLWVLENEVTRNSGSGIVISAGSLAKQPFTHHIYVGRNKVHNTRQAGIFTKQAVDVIFSQNIVYNIISTSWSPAKAAGFQYAPNYVWFLFNDLSSARYGIYAGSDSGLGSGTESFAIGNVIHDIHRDSGGRFSSGTAWSNAGIMMAGGVNRYIVNNTIYKVDGGINCPGSGAVHMSNNIVSGITERAGNHIFIERGSTASASSLRHSLFDGDVRVRWGSSRVYDLSGLQAAVRGQGINSINGDPFFVDVAGANVRLGSRSPAIDRGASEDVYSIFQNRYGLDIAKDATGVPRPQGVAYDIGAFEFQVGSNPAQALPGWPDRDR